MSRCRCGARPRRDNEVLRDAANLEILRDQATELEEDLRNGLLTQEAYEQGKRELQVRLIEEVKTTDQPATSRRAIPPGSWRSRWRFCCRCSVWHLSDGGESRCTGIRRRNDRDRCRWPRSAPMKGCSKWKRKLKRFPKSPNDWWTLARSYTELKRYADAATAYDHLVSLVPNEPQLWANYADVYAMAHGQTLQNAEVTKMMQNRWNSIPTTHRARIVRFRGDGARRLCRSDHPLAEAGRPGCSRVLADAQMYLGGIKRARELLAAQPGGKEKLAQLSAGKAPEKSAANAAANTCGSPEKFP